MHPSPAPVAREKEAGPDCSPQRWRPANQSRREQSCCTRFRRGPRASEKAASKSIRKKKRTFFFLWSKIFFRWQVFFLLKQLANVHHVPVVGRIAPSCRGESSPPGCRCSRAVPRSPGASAPTARPMLCFSSALFMNGSNKMMWLAPVMPDPHRATPDREKEDANGEVVLEAGEFFPSHAVAWCCSVGKSPPLPGAGPYKIVERLLEVKEDQALFLWPRAN